MKVAVFSSSSIPSNTANSVQVVNMADAFCRLGHDVLLIGRSRMGESLTDVEDAYDHYGVSSLLNLRRIPWQRQGALSGLLYAIRGTRWVIGFGADFTLSRNIIGSLLLVLLGQKVIHESHGIEGEKSRLWKWAFMALSRSKNLVGIVAISNGLAMRLKESLRHLEVRIIVAHDGARPSQYPSLGSRAVGERFRVGYAGSFYTGRGIEIILQTAKKCPWAFFYIIGNAAGNKVQISDSPENVKIVGEVPPGRVPEHLRSFDAVVAPYQVDTSDRKGTVTVAWMSPLKIFEYMASGVPIVASNLASIREILEDGVNCLLVEPGNPEKWADALGEIRNDRSLARTISANAHKLFMSNYTWEFRARLIVNFFQG